MQSFTKLERQWADKIQFKLRISRQKIKNDDLIEQTQKEIDRLLNLVNQQRDQAPKDFSDALRLAKSVYLEKEARFERLDLLPLPDYEGWEHDLEWLKNNTKGEDLGKTLYLKAKTYKIDTYLFQDSPWVENCANRAIALLNQAIKLGYQHPNVYFLRVEARCGAFNYGLALQDVDKVIETVEKTDELFPSAQSLRAFILVKMQKFDEVFMLYQEIRRHFHVEDIDYFDIAYKLEVEILCRYALNHQFGGLETPMQRPLSLPSKIVQLLDDWHAEMNKNYPKTASIIPRMLNLTK